MTFIPAKCTQCNANIEVDNSKEAALCPYCGAAFITEKAIVNYNTTTTNNTTINAENVNIIGADFNNIIKIADEAWACGNYKEAYRSYSKAYEIDCNNRQVMIRKALSSARLFTLNNCSYGPVIYAFENAFRQKDLQSEEELKFKINSLIEFNSIIISFYKLVSNSHEQEKNKIREEESNYQRIEQEARDLLKKAETETDKADRLKQMTAKLQREADELRAKVRKTESAAISFLQSNLQECICAQKCIITLYETYLLHSKIEFQSYMIFLKNLAEFYVYRISNGGKNKANKDDLTGLNEKIKELDPSYKPRKASGCYIATAVYGSYDAPEVWILRRYRDNVLDNNVLGRMFIKIYYLFSPVILKCFGNNAFFRNYCKRRLDKKVIKLKKRGFEDTEYFDKY